MGKASRQKRELRQAFLAMNQGQILPANRQGQPVKGNVHQIVAQSQSIEFRAGPTPPPEHVEAYERLLPGATNRFLVLTEGEAEHRRKHENEHLEIIRQNAVASRSLAFRGQICAFLIAIGGITAGYILGMHGAQITGGIIGGGGLVTIITAFLRGGGGKQPEK